MRKIALFEKPVVKRKMYDGIVFFRKLLRASVDNVGNRPFRPCDKFGTLRFCKNGVCEGKKHIADNVSYIVAHRAVKGEFGVDYFYAVFIYKNRAGM